MSPRSEYLAALIKDHPDLILTTSLSLVLCAIVFLGAFALRHRDRFQHAAGLPLIDDSIEGMEKENADA